MPLNFNKFSHPINISVQFSHSVVCDSLWPHEAQHARPPYPPPTLRVYPNSCLLSQWCHPAISYSVIHFSFCLQSFRTSGSFQMSQLFASGGQSIGVSASTSVLPMNTQDWFPLGWTGWISLQSKGLSSLLQHNSSKASILLCSAFFIVQLSYAYMTTGKTIALTRWTFVDQVMSLLFNMLSRFISFLLCVGHCHRHWALVGDVGIVEVCCQEMGTILRRTILRSPVPWLNTYMWFFGLTMCTCSVASVMSDSLRLYGL